jgi:hypothetical protein
VDQQLVAHHKHHIGYIYEESVLLYLRKHAQKTTGGLGKENAEKIHIQEEHEATV